MAKRMKNESSSGTIDSATSLINQRNWRITGGVAITGCAVMAFFARHVMSSGASPIILSVFWVIWLLLLLLAMYCVLLDIRYLRVQFRLHERELFEETLGNETFRRAIIEAQRAEQEQRARKEPE